MTHLPRGPGTSGLVWLTDVHLNFVPPEQRETLYRAVANRAPRGVLLGGDIGEAPSFAGLLEEFAAAIESPIYFVLGNHDYYRGSIAGVREQARQLSQTTPRLHWLPATGVVPLGPETALIGHGGWADARAGDFASSTVFLNDYLLISDLQSPRCQTQISTGQPWEVSDLLNDRLRRQLEQLGEEAAEYLRSTAIEAFQTAREVIVLMHVPPFLEACWHEGRLSDDNWSPHFVCAAAGTALREVMADRPDCRMTVLCGHTHGTGRAELLPNLTVLTGGAAYGHPAIQPDWPPV